MSTSPADILARPVPGWFHHGAKILELIDQHRPVVCVELGSWLGASAIPVARAIRRWGGTLACVDTWAGDQQTASATAKSPWLLVSCARHIIEAGVGANVRLIPATTAEAAVWWTQPIDYLYIDADHSVDGCLSDLWSWVPHVRPGGLVVGDDYGHPLFPGVAAAWEAFAEVHGLTLTRYQSDPPEEAGIQLVSFTKGTPPS